MTSNFDYFRSAPSITTQLLSSTSDVSIPGVQQHSCWHVDKTGKSAVNVSHTRHSLSPVDTTITSRRLYHRSLWQLSPRQLEVGCCCWLWCPWWCRL